MRHVVLVGPMGSGKTTVGRQVAEMLDRPFVDNDAALEQRTGRTAAQIAATDGVETLHQDEEQELLSALADPTGTVIAAAASVVESEAVRVRLAATGYVVWLRADPATLTSRMPNSPNRPMLDPDLARLVSRQSTKRNPLYQSVADVTIATDEQIPETTASAVVSSLPVSLRREFT